MNSIKRLSNRKIVILSIIVIVVIGLVVVIFSPSSAKSFNISAALSELTGIVQVRDTAQSPYVQVNDGFLLKQNMQLQTKAQSRVRLTLSTGSIIRLSQLTVFSLESQTPATQGGLLSIGLQAGKVWIVLKGGSLDVTSPAGLASVRGSYMSVWLEPNRITITCLEGKCAFKNTAGSVNLTSGQKVIWPNATNKLTVEKMDQADIQDWLDNVPEAAQIIAQISSLLASSTPPPTPAPTSTPIPTQQPTSTLAPTGTGTVTTGTVTPTGTGTVTTGIVAPTGTVPTATVAPSPIATLLFYYPANTFTSTPSDTGGNPTKTKTKAPTRTLQPTATSVGPTVPTATPRPTSTPVNPTRTSQPTPTPVNPTRTSQPTPTPVNPTRTSQPTATQVNPTRTSQPTATQVNPTRTSQPTATRRPTDEPETPEPTHHRNPTSRPSTPKPTETNNNLSFAPADSQAKSVLNGPAGVNGSSFQWVSIFEELKRLLP